MDKKKKNIIMILAVSIIVITFFSISYAALTFRSTSFNQQLVVGDIWMKYDELNGLSIEDAVPGSDYSNYFEFTISGKNTYDKKDIYYDFILNRGDLPTNKTEYNRIPDEYLKFKLVSVDDSNQETEIFTDKTYASLNNQRIYVETIEKNTTSEVNRKYRLYMTIDNSLEIGNKDTAVFTLEEWANAFASIRVNVTGDFSEKEIPLTASEIMLKAIETNTDASCNPIVEEDGIIYFSGTNDCVDFNYVWYSGKLWRITAIYPDGTMKMITEDAITTITYGEDHNFYTDENTTSLVYQWLNEDFLDTLYNYHRIIKENSTWNMTIDDGDISTKLEETTMVPAKVGLLNAYEYYMAYKNATYSTNYLNIGYYWHLLNSYDSHPQNVSHSGLINGGNHQYWMPNAVRPVIKLKSNIETIEGTGTKNDPIALKGDKEDAVPNTTLLNTRSSGEYVNFDGATYRIVGIENGTTKLNKIDYIRDENGEVLTKYVTDSIEIGLDITTGSDDYWDYYLNNNWYNDISPTYKSMLEKGTYYLGAAIRVFNGNRVCIDYKLAICATLDNKTTKECEKTDITYSLYVGIPRYGEMFASQLEEEGYLSAKEIWLITPLVDDLSYFLSVFRDGSWQSYPPTEPFTVRPSINLKSSIVIKSGSGTKEEPFEIGFPS